MHPSRRLRNELHILPRRLIQVVAGVFREQRREPDELAHRFLQVVAGKVRELSQLVVGLLEPMNCPRERRLGLLQLLVEGFQGGGPMPLDGKPQRTHQQLRVDLVLEEVVLGPLLERFQRQPLVVHAREHDDRHGGRRGANRLKGSNAAGVGKNQIDEQHVHTALRQTVHSQVQSIDVFQAKPHVGRLGQGVPSQFGFDQIVFDKQQGIRPVWIG